MVNVPQRTAVLVLPSEGYRISDYIEAAARVDVEVIVATDAHHGLAEDMGAQLIPIDFSRPEDSARRIAGARPHIDAVVPIDDRGVAIAAGAAALRNLAHNAPEAIASTSDKATMRASLSGVVNQPDFAVVEQDADIAALAQGLGSSVIVKPVGLAGSIGVIRVDDSAGLTQAVDRVRSIQSEHGFPEDHRVLVETYVDGVEVAVEGLITNGDWDTLAIFDKPDLLTGPYFPETHYVTPSRLTTATLDTITHAARKAATHLGIRQGPVHAEFRVTPDGEIVLLELAARAIGGLCGRALRFGLNETSLEELILRNAVGERVRGTRLAPGASGVSMIPVPRGGMFEGIDGTDGALAVQHVTRVDVSGIAGRPVRPLPEESTYLGFVFARASDPADVEAALRFAGAQLDVLVT